MAQRATGSREPIVIAFNKRWRRQADREVAAQNADKSRKELREKPGHAGARGPDESARPCSAMNRNDPAKRHAIIVQQGLQA